MLNMNIVSYWKDWKEVFKEESGFTIIVGVYDHMNAGNPRKAIGVHWGNYPYSCRNKNIITPCAIGLGQDTAAAMLSGLLNLDKIKGNKTEIDKINEAIEYLNRLD